MSKQFSDLGISKPLLNALSDLNIVTPTEIQQKTIPLLLSNKTDFVGLAKTGTGKTPSQNANPKPRKIEARASAA